MRSTLLRTGLVVSALCTLAGNSPADDSQTLLRVGAWPYGPAEAVEVDPERDLIFLGSGGVVLILDGADRSAPTLISDDLHTIGVVEDIAYDAAHQRLFAACGEGGLEIWDLSDPQDPVRLGSKEITYFGYETPVGNVELYGHFAIVECEWGYVHSLDVADPTNPVQVGYNGLMGNPARDIHVSADGQVHSSGAQRYQRLAIFADGSLHNSAQKDLTYGPYAVFGTEEVAYVGYGGYLFIIDLLYPGLPIWSETNMGGVTDIVAEEGTAYILNGAGLHMWDVRVHNNPIHLGSAAGPGDHYKLAFAEGYAYVAAGIHGLRIYETLERGVPTEVGSYAVHSVTWEAWVDDAHAYLAHASHGLLVLELGDMTRPVVVGQVEMVEEARDLWLEDGLAYVANLEGGLRIIDVSSPEAPAEVGSLGGFSAWRVLVSGDFAYVIESIPNEPYRLHVIDVTDPANPTERSTLLLPGLVWNLSLGGDYLYLAAHDSGVLVVEVTDPDAPALVGSYDLPSVTDLEYRDDLLYVNAHDNWAGGFFVLDVSVPTTPTYVGEHSTAGFAPFHLDVLGDYAYVSRGTDLHLINITDPATPLDLDDYRLPGDLFGVIGRDQYVFVADGSGGLQILENAIWIDSGGGLVWTAQDCPTNADLNDVQFIDRDRGWAVGKAGTVLSTGDGGETWALRSTPTTQELLSVCFLDGTEGWASGGGGTLLHSVDGGVSWARSDPGPSVEFSDVVFVDPSTGWLVGDEGTILHTTTGGASWQAQNSTTTAYLTAADFVDPLHGWVVTGNYGALLRTTTGGASWLPTSTGSDAILFGIDFTESGTGWAVGMFGDIRRSENAGLTWFPQENPHPPDWLYDVQADPAGGGWAVGFNGKIIHTDDGGSSWVTEPTGVHEQLNGVSCADEELAWAVGNEGRILHRTRSVSTVDPESTPEISPIVSESPVTLLTGAPNPFRGRTALRYGLSSPGRVQISVFDVHGRRVRRLLDEARPAGRQLTVWDGCDDRGRRLPAGVYTYRLVHPDGAAEGEVVLIH